MSNNRRASLVLRNTSKAAMGVVLCLLGTVTTATAQDAAPAQGPALTDGDIIVTARKRTETVQNVPATINVIGAEALATTGSTSLLQLASVAPGVNINKPGSGNEVGITIRGLGSLSSVPSFDSSVSLFADGVYLPRTREFAASMFDIARIEVIRGTQAALLGKNTSLGAVSLVSRKPGDVLAADFRALYEFERGSTQYAGGIDLPITDTLALRVAGQFSDDHGWVHNLQTDGYEPRRKDSAFRAVLHWQASDNLEITAIAQQGLSRNRGSGVEFTQTDGTPEILSALAGSPIGVEGKLDRRNFQDSTFQPLDRLKTQRYSLATNLQLGDYTLTSTTGYSRYSENDNQDIDFLPGDYFTRIVDESGRQFSQELRIASPADRPFDFIAGALYLNGKLDNKTVLDANFPFGPAPGLNLSGAFRTDFVQDTEAVSIFGQANYKLTDQFRMSIGGRWTHESKDVDLARDILRPGLVSVVVFPPYAPFSLNHKESNFDYSFGAQYDLNANAMLFASYGKGTKSGGFAQSVTILADAGYSKEVARTAEIGLKLQDAGRRWLFNISAFNTLVDNFQVVSFNGFAFVVGNTDLKSHGVEIEANWRPVDGLRLHLNNTYADAKDRITGFRAPLAPKWSGSGGFSYRTGLLQDLDFILDGSIDYRSRRTYLPNPADTPSSTAFTPINLSVALAKHDDGLELRLIGRNLTNEMGLNSGNPAPFLPAGNQVGTSERGRTIALQLSGRF
ncbi:MAG TPA: TonB-dependent receptor [Sphingobium sp.]